MTESWRILLFLFLFIDSFPLFFCQRFYDVSLQNSPQEIITINNGLKFVQEQQKNITSRKELLCSTFMNGKNPLSQRMLYVNLRRLHTVCDFAIVLYAGNPDEVPVCKRNSSSVIHCARAEITLKGPAPKKVYPKPFLYMELKPYLSNYRRVFLIDEDVSLFKFNYTIYSAIWNCGFYPSPPPLITQALVSEGTQWFNFVHFDKWRQGRKNVIWAVESVFIEQQAPLIDSIFLHWLLEYVIPPTLPLSMETGSDWGTDIIWCYAAYTYARQILHITDPNYVPCSILTKAPPIVHRDGKTIAFKKENFQRFNNEGFRMVALYRTLYPSWICNYTENAYNPLNEENKHLRKGYKLKKECYPHQLRIL
eukprot:gene13105-14381_t